MSNSCVWSAGLACVLSMAGGARGQEASVTVKADLHGGASISLFDVARTAPLPRILEDVLGCRMGELRERDEDGTRVLQARCNAAVKRFWVVERELNLTPLLAELRKQNFQRVWLTFEHPVTGFSECTPGQWNAGHAVRRVTWFRVVDLGAPQTLRARLAFGYRLSSFRPALALLIPPFLALLMMLAAVTRRSDATAVWFTYWRVLGWVMTGGWLVWVRASTSLDCGTLTRFLVNDEAKASLLTIGCYLIPPLLAQFVCTLISAPVLTRAGGRPWTLRRIVEHTLWHEPVNIWPLMCLGAASMSLAVAGDLRMGITTLGIGYFVRMGLVSLWLKWQKLNRYVPGEGELRARLRALENKSGVKLRQVYLLPAAEGRMPAPLLTRRRHLLLSDYLLANFSKREVDAVLAREMGHLKRYHRQILLAAVVLSVPAVYWLAQWPALQTLPRMLRGPMMLWLMPVFLYFLWRHFERAAERDAAAWTADPEAVLTALPKLARANLMGAFFRRWEERLLPRGEVRPLAVALPAPPAAADTYVAPVRPDERIFSAERKRSFISRREWVLHGAQLLTSVLVTGLIGLGHWTGAMVWIFYALGVAVTCAVSVLLSSAMIGEMYRRTERLLRARFTAAPQAGWSFVGLAPSAKARFYESFSDWDVGLCGFVGDSLCYVGEQTRFALPRRRVSGIKLAAGTPQWGCTRSLHITWRDERGRESTLQLNPPDTHPHWLGRCAVLTFHGKLEQWRNAGADAAAMPAALAGLGLPDFGEVTGETGAVLRQGAYRWIDVVVFVLMALGLAYSAYRLVQTQGSRMWYLAVLVVLANLFRLVPQMGTRPEPERAA
jgi:Zn-dependent protease with chaperone function